MPDKIITDVSILHQVSGVTTHEEIEKLDLKNRLIAALPYAWVPGLGLAAIQIGVPLQYAYYKGNGYEGELLNPMIMVKLGKALVKEGCLSIPGKWLMVERAQYIEYVSDGKTFKCKGIKAQLVQHEVDHMNGKLITDK
jgi:peptide deformylase